MIKKDFEHKIEDVQVLVFFISDTKYTCGH